MTKIATYARLIALSLFVTACPKPSGKEPARPAPMKSASVLSSYSGLVQLSSLAKLPKAHFTETPGYPGKGFHTGIFRDAASLDAFLDLAKAKGFDATKIDWTRHCVAFIVLDAQTNAIAIDGYARDGDTGVLSIEWEGIEPHYVDATPAVLAVVSKASIEKLQIRIDEPAGRAAPALGTFPVSVE